MTAARRPPTILCATCGKRKRKKGAIHSRHTGNYFCARCVSVEVRKPVEP